MKLNTETSDNIVIFFNFIRQHNLQDLIILRRLEILMKIFSLKQKQND